MRIFNRLTALENVLAAMWTEAQGPWSPGVGQFFRRACPLTEDQEACATADGLLEFVGISRYRRRAGVATCPTP